MAGACPELLREPNPALREQQHLDLEAVQEENKRLRELVVQLSKLVAKYVMAGASAAGGLRPIPAPLGREAAKLLDSEVPTSPPPRTGEVIK